MFITHIKKGTAIISLVAITFYAGLALAGPKGCVTCDVRCSSDGYCKISNCKDSPCS